MGNRSGLALAVFALVMMQGRANAAEPRNYDFLRAELVKSGYKSLTIKHQPQDHFCGEGFCKTYPETISCNQGGLHYCGMAFFKPSDGSYLVVDTLGEVEHKLTVVRQRKPDESEMKVIRGQRDF